MQTGTLVTETFVQNDAYEICFYVLLCSQLRELTLANFTPSVSLNAPHSMHAQLSVRSVLYPHWATSLADFLAFRLLFCLSIPVHTHPGPLAKNVTQATQVVVR